MQHAGHADVRLRVRGIVREDFLEARARLIEQPFVETALCVKQEQRRVVRRDREGLTECVEF